MRQRPRRRLVRPRGRPPGTGGRQGQAAAQDLLGAGSHHRHHRPAAHAEPACPNLAIGLALARPGEDPGGTGDPGPSPTAARGHKTGWLGYDRACTQALPGRFHLPARALGYSPVMDYRADQLGIQASTQGALLVEGTWYCPALPGPLITATTGLRGHAITRELYDQQITARCPYQLKHKDGPGHADGHQRSSPPPTAGQGSSPLPPPPLTQRAGAANPPPPPKKTPSPPLKHDHHHPSRIAPRHQERPARRPAWHARCHLPRPHPTHHPTRPTNSPPTNPPPPPPPAPPPPPLPPLHPPPSDRPPHTPETPLAGPPPPPPTRHPSPAAQAPPPPARLPPRRLTARSTHRHHRPAPPSRAAATPQVRQNAAIWLPEPVTGPARRPEPMSDPTGIIRNGHRSSSVGMTPAVLSVTLGGAEGI